MLPTLKPSAICAILLGIAFPLSASPVSASKPPATIRLIGVTEADDPDVTIMSSTPVIPIIQTVTDPERLIIEFPQALPSPDLHTIPVNRGSLKDVRVGLFSKNPPVTRVVLDLNYPTRHRMQHSGTTIVVKLFADHVPAAPSMLNSLPRHTPETSSAKTAAVVDSAVHLRSPAALREKLPGPTSMLRSLRVLHGGDAFQVEIVADRQLMPVTQVVENPNRLVLDFPGVFPSRDLHDLQLNRADVRGIRVGLFTSKPPVTRVVLDLNAEPQFELLPSGNRLIVKLVAREQSAIIGVVTGGIVTPLAKAPPAVSPVPAALEVSRRLRVSLNAGRLSIWADGASLSDVLYEVHRRTGADIPIPSLAWSERVVVNLGPGPAPEVLASLLTGSPFNFVIVGIPGDPSQVSSVQLTLKDTGHQPHSPSPLADTPPEPPTDTEHQPVPDTPPQPPLPPTPDTPPQIL